MAPRDQRGDTLIEVTIALAMVSLVLASSTFLALRLLQTGQLARERTTIAETGQEQLEQLRSFRDNHTWDEFLNGNADLGGVLAVAGSGCQALPHCFHMELSNVGATHEYGPVAGGTADSAVPSSYVELSVVSPPAGPPPDSVTFILSYGFPTLGEGPPNTGHIQTTLTNLKAGLAGGGSAPSGGALFGSPGSGGSGGHALIFKKTVINQSPIAVADVAGCSWDWGDGTVQTNTACNPGDTLTHTYPATIANYLVVLTEININGVSAQYSQNVHIPTRVSCTPGGPTPGCVPGP